jgi:pseudouridine kinase
MIQKDHRYVCVIGGSNVDIQGRPHGRFVARDSNIGAVRISLGGVGRNIAENLTRLGVGTRLVSVVGGDANGRMILEDARAIGLSVQDTLVLPGEASSVYLCILDETGDMTAAVNDMAILDRMTADFIDGKKDVIGGAALCVLDANIPAEVLDYILRTFQDTVFFLDPVSAAKAVKARALIGRFHTIKPNLLEAEALSGISIRSDDDLKRAAAVFHEQGVRQVFITLGTDGVVCSTPDSYERIAAPGVQVASATGAGDAFTAGLVLGYLRGLGAKESARLAAAAAAVALRSQATVSPAMSPETLYETAKELGLC